MMNLLDLSRDHLLRGTLVMVFAGAVLAGCGDDGSGGTGGSGASGGSSNGGSSNGGSSNGGSGDGGTSQGGQGGTGSTTTNTTTNTTTTSTGMVDPYAAERQACMAKINELRGTKSLPAYAEWTDAETCADQQATSDESANDPHGAFGMCGEFGQNECLGAGPAGIAQCLQSMWDERLQADCQGCDACADAYDPNCPGCDFYGQQHGQVCGHYVNLSAKYFSMAACGFSSGGGWDTIDFK
ncbi:MAG: hypothetical protein U0271_30965 [Polyangiaceae bacterium]